MYLSLTIIYLGEAGVLVQVWPMPLLLLTLIYVQLIVIPYEENQLQKQFGATYRQYCAKVLRWI
jgi:protein-S-isoprenylcysteine O-methyltransferase Ste14